MRPPVDEIQLSPPPWRAGTSLPSLSLTVEEVPNLAAPTAATRSPHGVAAASAPPPEVQQPVSSGCCFAFGLLIAVIILVVAWAIRSDSRAWEDY